MCRFCTGPLATYRTGPTDIRPLTLQVKKEKMAESPKFWLRFPKKEASWTIMACCKDGAGRDCSQYVVTDEGSKSLYVPIQRVEV